MPRHRSVSNPGGIRLLNSDGRPACAIWNAAFAAAAGTQCEPGVRNATTRTKSPTGVRQQSPESLPIDETAIGTAAACLAHLVALAAESFADELFEAPMTCR